MMTDEKVTKQELTRNQRFARAALTFAFILMVVADIALWKIKAQPDAQVMLVTFLPILSAVVLAYIGRTELAVWLFGASFLGGIGYLTISDPQSFFEIASLAGRYIFPLVMVLPIGWFSLNGKRQQLVFSGGTLVAMLGLALYGHAADPEISTTFSGGLLLIAYGMAVVAVLGLGYLVISNFRRGLQLFRASISVKLGVGFFLITLVTIGYLVVGSSLQNRYTMGFDYSRYADNKQILINGLSAEIGGMRLNLIEYLLVEDSDEAYADYIGEYEEHRANANILFEQMATLLDEGLGLYVPGDTTEAENAALATVQLRVNQVNTKVREVVDLIDQHGYNDMGLSGELRQAAHVLEGFIIFQNTPEMKVLLLQMRGHEKDWMLRQEQADADAVNSYGAEAIALMRTMEISSADQLAAESMINEYLEKFNQLVDIDKQITALMAVLSRSAEPISSELEYLVESANAETEVAKIRLGETQNALQNSSIVFGASAVLVATLVGIVATRAIIRPIISLTQTANELAEGNLDVRAEVISQDETGRLAGVFNQMADRLQNTMAGLEQTVQERTAELENRTVEIEERAREMEASQRVTFAASERTSPGDFLDLLVNLIADQFDVYHCQVYLVDEEKNTAALSQSTGYAGRQLLQRGHSIPLDAQSLVTQCINTGEPVLVAETVNDPNWLPNPLLPLTQSELVVPLKIDEKVIGVLDIQDRVANRFTNASVPLFAAMTEQVAFLYENNELLDEIAEAQQIQEQFVTQLKTTSDVVGQLATILDPTQLLDQAVTMLQSRFNFYHAHIYLVDEAKKNLVVATGSGHVGVILKDSEHSIPVDAEKSFVAAAYRNASPVRVEDTTQDPGWLPNPLLPNTRAEMAVPLITRGQVIGVLDIQDEVVGRFTEVDEDTMLTLAGQLATSVDTARLFVDVEKAAERDRVRFEIAEALSGNPTEEEVWDILLEKAIGEGLMVTLLKADKTDDGELYVDTYRSISNHPELKEGKLGQRFYVSQAPGLEAIITSGKIAVSHDVAVDDNLAPDLRQLWKSRGIVSMLFTAFTLSGIDEWEGFIGVSSAEPNYFTPDRVHMYTALIELGTVALRSARLRGAIADAAERDRKRFEIAEALSGNPTEEEVWDVLLEKALGDENIAVALHLTEMGEDGQMYGISHRIQSNNPILTPGKIGTKQNMTQNPAYPSLAKGETFISNNVADEDRLSPELREYLLGLNASSIMFAIFAEAGSTQEEWLGVYSAYSPEAGYFTPERVSMFDSLLEMGTVALRATRLRDAVAHAAERDRIRFEIAEAFSGNPTEEEVWDILLEKALDEGLMVTLLKAGKTDDGRLCVDTYRSISNNPELKEGKPGQRFFLSQAPGFEAIINSGEIAVSHDVAVDDDLAPDLRELWKSRGVVSMLLSAFTLSGIDEWEGFIGVSSAEPNYFTPDRVYMYTALRELGTVALRSARVRDAEAKAAKRTATRLEITRALTGNLTEDAVLDILVEKAALYPDARISIYYEDLESDVREIVAQRDEPYNTGMHPLGAGYRISNDVMDFEHALKKDEITIFENVDTDERLDEATKVVMRQIGFTSMATIPMHMADDWLGYIFVTSKEEAFFIEEKISLYNILAEAGTTALRGARLGDAVTRAAERDRKRFEIAEALSGNLTEEEIWAVLVDHLVRENLQVTLNSVERAEDGIETVVIMDAGNGDQNLNDPVIGSRLNADQNPGWDVLSRGEIFVSPIVENDERFSSELREYLVNMRGIKSLVLAPISVSGEGVDILIGLNSSIPGFFDETDTYIKSVTELGTAALREARLRTEADQERERFRVLIENAPEAIVVLNGETGEFMEANQNAVELYEVPINELIGNNPVALSPETQPDGRPSSEAAMGFIQETIEGGAPVFDWVHTTGKGRDIPCEIRLVRLPGYDNPPRLRGSIMDISERAAAQQAIVQGDRLKSEFLANMSHELRTPLNSIMGYTDVLLLGLDGELDEEVTTDLEAIYENSQHLLNLINDILDLAKIEAGRMTIEVGDVDVSNLLQEVKKTSAGLLVNKEVEMIVEADEKLPAFQADYHRVYQVVNNLVSNAVKFTEKGTITLRALAEGDEMVLQVEDTGIGISKEDLEVIFEEFTQADTSSTRQHEGTGLGLTITRRLVQMHGGSIMVESELGKGSIFTARFPMEAKVNPELLTVVQSSNGSK